MKRLELGIEAIATAVEAIKEMLRKGGIVILQGDLAAGKTTLVKAFAAHEGLGDVVTSPTFSLQQCYGGNIYHYDIYNKGLDNFLALGLLEELEKPGFHLVEWGDERLKTLLQSAGLDVVVVEIEKADNRRIYRIEHA